MSKKEIKTYEVCFHLLPTLDDSEATKLFGEIQSYIKSKGEILSQDEPEMIDLAYVILGKIRNSEGKFERFEKAHFASLKFKSNQATAEELNEMLKKNESILRFILMITVDESTRVSDAVLSELEKEEDEPVRPKRNSHKEEKNINIDTTEE